MSNPDLLMCDKVSLGLSPSVIKDIYGAFPTLRGEGLFLIVVEQDIDTAMRVADYVYCFMHGRITLRGAPGEMTAVPRLPWVGSSGFMRWAVEVMCYLILAQIWNLMAGYGGLMSVGIQAFVGVGANFVIAFAQHLGVNPFLAIPLASVVAALFAMATAPLVFRMRGGYFAIGAWVLAQVFRIGFSNVRLLGGGSGQSLRVMTRFARPTREILIYEIAAALLIAASVAIYCSCARASASA
ncbi:MAG: hypothetical protein KGM15_08230 [Pseudomonadota bacterium]|nr:hypothetical protein [Pseudomonadota bacterium]